MTIFIGETNGRKLKPLDIERQKTPDGLYLIVVSKASKNW
jgi:hypothetical protein